MTTEYNIIKKLPDNKIIIEETKKNNSKNHLKYYLLNEEHADLFIKNKKNSDLLTKTQSVLSMVVALSIALYVGMRTKTDKIKNTLFGIGAGAITFAGGEIFDRWFKKNTDKRILKLFNAKEIQLDDKRPE